MTTVPIRVTDPLFWVGLVIGLLTGVVIGTFVIGLAHAGRDEHERTGH